jgi:hypothetical protein
MILVPPPEKDISIYPCHGIGFQMPPGYIGWVRTNISIGHPRGVWAFWDGRLFLNPGETLITEWDGTYITTDASGVERIKYDENGVPDKILVPKTKVVYDRNGRFLIKQRVEVVGWDSFPVVITNLISQGKKVVKRG